MGEENRVKLESLRFVLTDRGGTGEQVQEILRIVREEFDPHYSVDAWCSSCVMNMVIFAFGRLDSLKK